jgi:phosphoribosyl 1,2-cyclic phosphodiesterase
MRARFWGVRGTIAAPGPTTIGIGGNTPCVEVRTATNALLVLDAGIGLCWLGRSLLPGPHGRGQGETTILLSRTHWGHIQGIPFFVPAFLPGNKIHIYGAALASEKKSMSLRSILEGQMREAYSPIVTLGNMPSITSVRDVIPGQTIEVGGCVVRPLLMKNRGDEAPSIAYRIEEEGRSLVYMTDVDYVNGAPDAAALELARGADLLVHEAYYTEDERSARPAGPPALRQQRHATFAEATELALRAGARRLFYSHHHPEREDDEILRLVEAERSKVRERGVRLDVDTAREGVELTI